MTVDPPQQLRDPERLANEPDATFWSDADQVYVSVFVGARRYLVWDEYLSGLQACYSALGVDHIVTDELVRPEDCSLVWLIHDRDWRIVGGARAVGPFLDRSDVANVPAASEFAGSSSESSLREQLADLIEDGGLIEVKGGWTHRSQRGLGSVVGCFGWFCTWWFGVRHALATAGGENNLRRWEETGARRLVDVEPLVGHPAAAYDTEPMLWSRRNLDGVPDRHRAFLWTAIRQLHGARSREMGVVDLPELVHRPERIAHLQANGVQLVDQTDALA